MLISADATQTESRLRLICSRFASPLRAFARSRAEGSALVELAVTLPIIFLIMTGIFAFSIALYQKLALAEGASAGARLLATERGQVDPCSATASAVIAAAPSLNSSEITYTIVLDGNTQVNGVQGSSNVTCAGSKNTANTYMVSGAAASLTLSYPCTIKVYNFNFAGCSLGTSVSEEIQ